MMNAPIQTRPLLLELLTEELPPKALHTLGQAFARHLRDTLAKLHLLADDCICQDFATPRRLAVHLGAVRGQAPQQAFSEKLMPAQVGLDTEGNATPALLKKLAGKGWQHLRVQDLVQESDGKQLYLYARGTADGIALAAGLQQALDAAIAALPIPKLMQYQLADGVTTVKFVRPAHRLLALWGDEIVAVQALGLQAGRTTQGHRFMAPAPLDIAHADEYESRLHDEGRVIASFAQRRDAIAAQLAEHEQRLTGVTPGQRSEEDTALLDEVTALVEWPVVYVGEFDEEFLAVPSECLMLTMRQNQKYFPVIEPRGGFLMRDFLIVSNMEAADPRSIIEGNERVIRPRLADAKFFFDTDRKQALAERIPVLAHAVYHNKLGSQWQRSQRIEKIARFLAQRLDADEALATRAAQLLKADLTTAMVGEFPELQGIMGSLYAEADGEDRQVVTALRCQYWTRFTLALDRQDSPQLIPAIVYLAERAETLIGIWGIGLAPTGERDPYALRRAALGLISVLENPVIGKRLSLDTLLQAALQTFEPGVVADGTLNEVSRFVVDRCRNQLYGTHDKTIVDAVMAGVAPPMFEIRARIAACVDFLQLPDAASLIAANKRLTNLLKKAEGHTATVNAALLSEPAEHALAQAVETLAPVVQSHLQQGDYPASLKALAGVRQAVDDFFEHVMVMAEDSAIRANRLALLHQLHGLMNQVADISRLAA